MKTASKTPQPFGLLVALLFIVLAVLPTDSRADSRTFAFTRITANSPVDVASQFSLVVSDYGTSDTGANRVLFTFGNNLPPYTTDSPVGTITRVFFEDGAIIGPYEIVDGETSPGVDFTAMNGNGGLPGGGELSPPFEASKEYASRFDPSGSGVASGVDPGEWLGIVFDLEGEKTFSAVIAAINKGFTDPAPWTGESLRIGIHVQSLPDADGLFEESDSFILVPVPGAALIGLLGMGAAGVILRRFT